eukprot:TRINITY_DN2622_c0_g1_i2.p1 TRINITY_DN2622_c0_g1~~TRINITY_DN2622_c0_g1_i2.p1  ORF type:complete len:189 (-),score=66.76 TRINITY_DN2622_c0_g1_i2:216-782(-)
MICVTLASLAESRPSYESNHLDSSSNNPLRDGATRMAKYFFEGRSSGGSALAKNFGLDVNAVTEGLLKPDNIAIHVLQNAVNFFSSTLAWVVLGGLASASGIGARESSSSSYSFGAPYNYHHIGKSLPLEDDSKVDDISSSGGYRSSSNALRKRQLLTDYDPLSERNKEDRIIAIRKLLRRVVNNSSS